MARPQRTHDRAGSSRTARSSGMPSILVRQSWLSRWSVEGHQRQRGEEMLAELAIAHPGRALAIDLERERIDEDRPAPMELHVVGAAILQAHPVLEGTALDLQGGEGGVPVLAEAPLVGIRDELDRLGPDDLVGQGRIPILRRQLFVRDQQSRGDQSRRDRTP